jgi:hypothetical protein
MIPDPKNPGEKLVCFTCQGAGAIDPAVSPTGTLWEMLRQFFFGA